MPRKSKAPPAASTPPACPAFLMDGAKEEWGRLVPHLQTSGLLTHLDMACLASYCQAYAEWKDAIAQIAATGGPVVKGAIGSPIPNPYVAIKNNAAKTMLQALAQLGLSPAARSRMEIPSSALDDLLNDPNL